MQPEHLFLCFWMTLLTAHIFWEIQRNIQKSAAEFSGGSFAILKKVLPHSQRVFRQETGSAIFSFRQLPENMDAESEKSRCCTAFSWKTPCLSVSVDFLSIMACFHRIVKRFSWRYHIILVVGFLQRKGKTVGKTACLLPLLRKQRGKIWKENRILFSLHAYPPKILYDLTKIMK